MGRINRFYDLDDAVRFATSEAYSEHAWRTPSRRPGTLVGFAPNNLAIEHGPLCDGHARCDRGDTLPASARIVEPKPKTSPRET